MTHRPKKSEMLELRLSHPDKSALKRKAVEEGRTVSALVRDLISDYLQESEDAAQAHLLRRLSMFLIQRPKTILTIAALAAVTSIAVSSSAQAQNVLISVESIKEDPAPWSKSTAFLRNDDEFTCVYLENTTRSCNLTNLKPNLLAATFGVRDQGDMWTVEVEIRRGDDIHKSELMELRPREGGTLIVETPSGHEITILAVINEDESLTIPLPLQKL